MKTTYKYRMKARFADCACGNKWCGLASTKAKHGALHTYTDHKCRCELCVEVKKKAEQRYIQKRVGQGRIDHGTVYAYSRLGCRCEPCKEAMSVYGKKLRDKAKASRERMKELASNGQ